MNHLFEVFARAEEVAGHATFEFSCRGCGQHCCANTQLFLTPPEVMRVLWHLERHPEFSGRLKRRQVRWGEMGIGHSTGLPTLQMVMQPFGNGIDGAEGRCSFLVPVHHRVGDASIPTGMHWCGLHTARPVACRTFPLGVASIDGELGGYAITARCPGFTSASEGDPVPPGYTPPSATQTVEQWVSGQMNPEQMAECRTYTTLVVPQYLEQSCHAPTEDHPGGMLDDEQALKLGAAFFYRPIPAPEDPAQDHATLMAWMEEMIRALPQILAQL